MLALQRSSTSANASTAHVLPCRIHHDGPTKITKRYWSPRAESDGTQTSYFRGRKLRGRVVKLPDHYRGVVAKATEQTLPTEPRPKSIPPYTMEADGMEMEEDEDEEEMPELVKIMEELATFEEVVVWGHDMVPGNDDAFVKGLEEWIGFAEAIHGTPGGNADAVKAARDGQEEQSPK